MSTPTVDPTFTALPYRKLADAALSRARDFNVAHADFRFERIRYQHLAVRDGVLQDASDHEDLGFAVRVIHHGAWGFASGVVLTSDEAIRIAEEAVQVAMVASRMTTRRIRLAPEPVHDDVTWVSAYDINPLEVPVAEKSSLLVDWTRRLTRARRRRARGGRPAAGPGEQVLRRPGRHPHHPAADPDACRASRRWAPTATTGVFDSMRSIAPPVGRGWEFLRRPPARLGRRARARCPSCSRRSSPRRASRPATTTWSSIPSNLWLTIHESIGHATELDRAFGYEANYAGTSFATYDKLNTLQYGSPVMNVTGDRTVEHGLATIGYDDEGVRDAVVGHRPRRRAGRLPARPADGAPQARAQRRPLQRLRVRRLPRPHPDPADGQRLPPARPRTARRPRS